MKVISIVYHLRGFPLLKWGCQGQVTHLSAVLINECLELLIDGYILHIFSGSVCAPDAAPARWNLLTERQYMDGFLRAIFRLNHDLWKASR